MNLQKLLALLLGIAETSVLPIFIHNAKSQAITHVVVTDVNAVANSFGIPTVDAPFGTTTTTTVSGTQTTTAPSVGQEG